jgi:hypothetical protein
MPMRLRLLLARCQPCRRCPDRGFCCAFCQSLLQPKASAGCERVKIVTVIEIRSLGMARKWVQERQRRFSNQRKRAGTPALVWRPFVVGGLTRLTNRSNRNVDATFFENRSTHHPALACLRRRLPPPLLLLLLLLQLLC